MGNSRLKNLAPRCSTSMVLSYYIIYAGIYMKYSNIKKRNYEDDGLLTHRAS